MECDYEAEAIAQRRMKALPHPPLALISPIHHFCPDDMSRFEFATGMGSVDMVTLRGTA